VITERVLNLRVPKWAGFHDEDGRRFQALSIVRHWIHGVIVRRLSGWALKQTPLAETVKQTSFES